MNPAFIDPFSSEDRQRLVEHNGDEINLWAANVNANENNAIDPTTRITREYHLTEPMRLAKNLTAKLTVGYDESHNLQHHLDVLFNAASIMDDVADRVRYMVEIAALLHDVVDHKYTDTIEANTRQLTQFLENIADGGEIQWIINNISYSKEASNGYPVHEDTQVQLARDIVSDADKLEAIGDKGIERCYQFTRAFNPMLTDTEVTARVVAHCHDKLLSLHKYMRTERGKTMAMALTAEVEQWVAAY